jgi:phospholipid/cholesterol/gamma-HCH transport system substrate-binding protein
MSVTGERTLVGIFVLVAAVLLFGTVIVVSGGIGNSGVPHPTYFKFAGGIQPGGAVRFGGLTVGKVKSIHVDPKNTTRIEVQVVVDKDAPIKTDSVAKITTLGALGDNYIEVSTGTENSPLLPSGAVLKSVEAFGLGQLGELMDSLMPDVKAVLAKVSTDLDGLETTITRANDLLNDKNRANLGGTLETVNSMLAETRPRVAMTLDNLNGLLNETRPQLSATLTDARGLMAKLGPVLDDLKVTTTKANDLLTHVDAVMVENRADIRTSVTGLRDTLAKSQVLLDQLNTLLDTNSPNIDATLDNLRLATENIRGLTENLERNPSVIIRGVKVQDRRPGDVPK